MRWFPKSKTGFLTDDEPYGAPMSPYCKRLIERQQAARDTDRKGGSDA